MVNVIHKIIDDIKTIEGLKLMQYREPSVATLKYCDDSFLSTVFLLSLCISSMTETSSSNTLGSHGNFI